MVKGVKVTIDIGGGHYTEYQLKPMDVLVIGEGPDPAVFIGSLQAVDDGRGRVVYPQIVPTHPRCAKVEAVVVPQEFKPTVELCRVCTKPLDDKNIDPTGHVAGVCYPCRRKSDEVKEKARLVNQGVGLRYLDGETGLEIDPRKVIEVPEPALPNRKDESEW